MTKVSIIILNWNRAGDTIECVRSVSKCQRSNVECQIVVVDNASTDDSVKKLKRFKIQDSRFKILVNKENLGFAGGNNSGIDYAMKKGADWVLILNNDTIVDKDLIVELLKVSRKHPKVGILSPKIYFAKGFEFHKKRYKKSELGRVIWAAGGYMDWDNVFGKNRGVDEVDKGQYKKIERIDFATGACMLISSKALKDVGVFDSRYFMYFEDVDLCSRMLKSNWNIMYIPKALVWHKVAQSSSAGSNLNDYYISRNRMLFGLKYAPLRSKVALMDQSFKFLLKGRQWQKKGVIDFYIGKYGKGSWVDK